MNNIIRYTLISISAIVGSLNISCQTLSVNVDTPSFPKFSSSKVYVVKKAYTIYDDFDAPIGSLVGNVWNLDGYTLDGKKLGSCSDKEGQPTIKIRRNNLTIKNGSFQHFPDGIQIDADNVTFDNVTFYSCEDAVNTGLMARNYTIKNCWFAPSPKKTNKGDKALQLSRNKQGKSILRNNLFTGYINGVRVGLNKAKHYKGTVESYSNKFYNVETAYHVVAGNILILNGKDKYYNVRQKTKTESGATIKNR